MGVLPVFENPYRLGAFGGQNNHGEDGYFSIGLDRASGYALNFFRFPIARLMAVPKKSEAAQFVEIANREK